MLLLRSWRSALLWGRDLSDRYLCPVRALCIYIWTGNIKEMTRVAGSIVCEVHTKWFNTGDISKQTVSGWVRSVFKQAYLAVNGENLLLTWQTPTFKLEISGLLTLPWLSINHIPWNRSWKLPLGRMTTRLSPFTLPKRHCSNGCF